MAKTTKKEVAKPIEELKEEIIIPENNIEVTEIPEPVPQDIVVKKEASTEPEEMNFLRLLVHTQHHGGRGAYLNKVIISRAKKVLGIDNVFIENGEIIK